MKNFSQIDGLIAKKDTLANLTALARVEGIKYYATDTKKYYTDNGTDLIEEGSGSGTGKASIIVQINADDVKTTDWTIGSQVTGSLGEYSVLPISGTKSYEIVTPTIGETYEIIRDIPYRSRGEKCSFRGVYSSNSTAPGNIKVSVFDIADLVNPLDTVNLTVGGDAIKWSLEPKMLDSTAQIKIVFEVITVPSFFIFDDIEIDDSLFTYKNLTTTESYHAVGHAGYGSTNIKIPYFTTVNKNETGKLISISNSNISGMSITAVKDCSIVVTRWLTAGVSTFSGISLNSIALSTNISALPQANILGIEYQPTGQTPSLSATYKMAAGDVIRPHDDGVAPSAGNSVISVLAQAESEYIVSPATVSTEDAISTLGASMVVSSHTVDNISKLGTLSQSGTYTFTASRKVNVLVSASLSTQTANFTQVRINKNGSVVSYSSTPNVATTTAGASAQLVLNSGDVLTITSTSGTAAGGFATLMVSDYSATFLAAVPTIQTRYVNTHATLFRYSVPSSTLLYKTAPLVSTSGETNHFSISGDRLLLNSKGTYRLSIPFGGYDGGLQKDLLIHDFTNNATIKEFLYAAYISATGLEYSTNLIHTLTIDSPIEVQFKTKSQAVGGFETVGRIEVQHIK